MGLKRQCLLQELSKVKMAGRYCLKNRLSFVEFLLIQRGEERRGEVMRYSFIWRDVFFFYRKTSSGQPAYKGERRKGRMRIEERAIVTTATAAQSG